MKNNKKDYLKLILALIAWILVGFGVDAKTVETLTVTVNEIVEQVETDSNTIESNENETITNE